MKWISISTILFYILFVSISLPFSRAATQQDPNENALATFLGLFNGFSTAAAFLISLLLANKLFASFGIMLSILALPVIYLAGFAGLVGGARLPQEEPEDLHRRPDRRVSDRPC